MIQYENTRFVKTLEYQVAEGSVFPEEGIAGVLVREADGQTRVQPSTGAAGETFAGLSLSRNVPPSKMVNVEETIAGTEAFVLARTPAAGQLLVKVGDVKMTIEVGAAPSANTAVAIDGDAISFHADHADEEVFVQYAYDVTVDEARLVMGDAPIGGLSSTELRQIGMIANGTVTTNMFDASADWSDVSVMHPSLGANGLLTVGGAGTKLTNVIIKSAPVAGNPLLTVEIA